MIVTQGWSPWSREGLQERRGGSHGALEDMLATGCVADLDRNPDPRQSEKVA
jgi:hypothetical protein